MRNLKWISTLWVLLICANAYSQLEQPDTAMISQIRREAIQHSNVMEIAEYLTEVSGPRLTNSPGFFRAANWSLKTFRNWGIGAARLEPWGIFGQGWSTDNSSISIQAPYFQPIIGYPLAWTRGTNGPITAELMLVNSLKPDSLKKYGAAVKGKIILLFQADTVLPSPFIANATRFADTVLANMKDRDMMRPEELEGMMQIVNELRNGVAYLQKAGAAAVLNMSPGDRDGTVSASAWFTGKQGAWPELPVFNIATEHYLQLQRLKQNHIPVTMTLQAKNTFYTKDLNGYNVIAEIPGTDPLLKNEVVMLGAHLDSWYSGTGATDNAVGCAVTMEVMRIFQSLHIKPRRTIRIALWSGEEQGLLGSYGYVLKHFGNPETMQLLPEHAAIAAYYNLDNGSGKIRGIFMQEDTAAGPIFSKWLEPFAGIGANTVTLANTGLTDHFSFDAVGIPAFQFIQDPLEYESKTHHTNMDTYDHLFPDDMKQSVLVMASIVYQTAMRNEKIPAKPLPVAHPWLFRIFK